jgi:D-sedoheptulose 7-phosphate isomerase
MTTMSNRSPHLNTLFTKFPDLEPLLPELEQAYELLHTCYRGGRQVLICGNGGSAADSEHVVGELMKGYLQARPVPPEVRARLVEADPEAGGYLADHLQGALPTISLVSQTALITAIANDIAGDMIFAQQVYGYGRRGDVLVAISTSGRSRNVVQAVRVAHALGLPTLGMTGGSGGNLKGLCTVTVCVPPERTADIQERHLAIYHAVCAMLEEALFAT